MKNFGTSLRLMAFFTIVCGLIYPLVSTALSELLFLDQATGQQISRDGKTVGSKLIAQSFESPRYFWPRPSAIAYNTMPSGGSNLSVSSVALKQSFEKRRTKLLAAHPGAGEPPQDLLFASGSGLDPDVSVAAAQYQIRRVAKARGLSEAELSKIIILQTEHAQLGVLGEERVNVLELNLALDRLQSL